MITSLRLVDFKNFRDETLRVGPFTVIVGANASGKSNIRDAFRFLHGIGRGYTLTEIIAGKYGAGGHIEWEQIRGAASEVIRFGEPAFGLQLALRLGDQTATYWVEVSREIESRPGFRITYEQLRLEEKTVFEKPRSTYDDRQVHLGSGGSLQVAVDRPILTQILDERKACAEEKEFVEPVINFLAHMRCFEPVPDRTRFPADPGQTVLGDRGENLAAVLRAICADTKDRELLASWIRELTPMDVGDLEFPIDTYDDRIRLFIREMNGRKVSAASASDGTLRFLMLLAAMFGPLRADLYFFEEIDAGIHAARLGLLLNLIEQQSAKGDIQVLTTTHSTDMLTIAGDTTFKHMSVVCRREHSHDAIIRPIADLPNAGQLRKSQGLGRLLAGGWMETALAFTEEDNGDETGPE